MRILFSSVRMRSSQDLLLKWNFSLGDWLEGCNILISIRWQSLTKVVELISSDLFPVSVLVSKLRFFCLLKYVVTGDLCW